MSVSYSKLKRIAIDNAKTLTDVVAIVSTNSLKELISLLKKK